MADLVTTPNLPRTDDFYAALLAAHEGLSEAEMHDLNARLILVLANHIGDLDVLTQALAVAGGQRATTDPTKT
ncbi:DUF2783 domain-containing protein [Rhodobacterales bacterium HKCCE3408]|nr:DUF2783 domain-containing protein [Rhodobacterales bacterium HKCCE3408]